MALPDNNKTNKNDMEADQKNVETQSFASSYAESIFGQLLYHAKRPLKIHKKKRDTISVPRPS